MPRSLTLAVDRPPFFYPAFCKLSQSLQMSSNSNSIDSVINRKQAVDLQLLVFAVWHKVAPPGFCNRGDVRYGSIGGLEYEVPQSRLYCLCINVALCSTVLQCICRVTRRSSMTMKAHTYYINFERPPIGGGVASPLPPGGATDIWTRTCESSSTSAVDVIFILLLSIFFLSFSS